MPASSGTETMLPPKYDPKSVEHKRYEQWEKSGYFSPDSSSNKPTYTIIMPPPNVTGVLHMGHALMATLEDILVRRKRMQGYNALWLPGTDHAGIATQMVVERMLLKEENKTKHDLGREAFLKRVWEWKEKSQHTILSQLRKIGSSCDWSRLCFTLDPGPVRAVRECFVRLFDEGLIYQEQTINQWCPRCHTALSDLEVKFENVSGHLWQIKYYLEGDSSKWLTVATTRPETLLGDTAVAIHPEDDRYIDFRGKQVVLPLLDRKIPVIEDEYVDREFGTGALKITPAHDPNDYEIGKKHSLPTIGIFDDSAKLNENGGPYQGLSREAARKKMLEDLDTKGLLENEEKYSHSVGHCDRCRTVLEPKISKQWFVNAKELAKEAIRVVESGEIKIVPKEWEKTYFEWMRNIRPWCISRQLWWGHRIPVWACQNCGLVKAFVDEPSKCPKCSSSDFKQDDDVLDTWFSSGLWPISTLGWPEQTKDLEKFYPSDVMETGFDILFFWVARMIMMGIKMNGNIPFHTIYLHPMVRDEYGQKMSKTKGNVKDPLDIISETGADCLRYYFAANTFHGRDIRVTDGGLDGARNFVNKLWNASRFVQMHFSDLKESNIDKSNEINQWILASFNDAVETVNHCLDEYRFFDAAKHLYHFVWDTYCSWFVEFVKSEEELKARKEKQDSTAIEVLEGILRLAHPIMPFVTEEIWQSLSIRQQSPSLMVAAYPIQNEGSSYPEAKKRLDRVIGIVDGIRTYRGTTNLSPAAKISAVLVASQTCVEAVQGFGELIKRLAGVSELKYNSADLDTKTHVMIPLSELKVFIPKEELGDLSSELERREVELEKLQKALKNADAKLNNPGFCNKAPQNVVDGVKKQREELALKVADIEKYLQDNRS